MVCHLEEFFGENWPRYNTTHCVPFRNSFEKTGYPWAYPWLVITWRKIPISADMSLFVLLHFHIIYQTIRYQHVRNHNFWPEQMQVNQERWSINILHHAEDGLRTRFSCRSNFTQSRTFQSQLSGIIGTLLQNTNWSSCTRLALARS